MFFSTEKAATLPHEQRKLHAEKVRFLKLTLKLLKMQLSFLSSELLNLQSLEGNFSHFFIVRWPKHSGWQLEETEMKSKVSPQTKKTKFFCSRKRQSDPKRVIFSCNECLLQIAPFSCNCSLWLRDSP